MLSKTNLKLQIILASSLILTTQAYAVDGVTCMQSGVNYDLCNSGTISKITYRPSTDSALINGISAPGCGTGWVLSDVTLNENNKQMYATLLSAYYAAKPISLTRFGASCTQWDGVWKGRITEISLN